MPKYDVTLHHEFDADASHYGNRHDYTQTKTIEAHDIHEARDAANRLANSQSTGHREVSAKVKESK